MKILCSFPISKKRAFVFPECVFLLILLPPGRSWKASELRLKSWDDLQKLWYVLLKEKNMLMTQRQMLHAQNFRFPNPERLPKVYPIFFACILTWACHCWCSQLLKCVSLFSCTDNDLNNLALQRLEWYGFSYACKHGLNVYYNHHLHSLSLILLGFCMSDEGLQLQAAFLCTHPCFDRVFYKDY